MMQNGLLTALTVKIELQKPKITTAAILKSVKLPYLRNRSADFDEIRQDDTYWPLRWSDR